MTVGGRRLCGVAAGALVLAADQVSKWWVLERLDLPKLGSVELLPVLNFTMVWNRGVTFGLLAGNGGWTMLALAGLALCVVAALCVWLWRAERGVLAVALGAIGGGAVGNVVDRLRFGAVVDFIHAHAWGLSWYVFNVADAAIVCGVAVLLVDSVRPRRAPRLAGESSKRLAADAAPR